ncbi:uncharacterized protein LOC128996644 [Macrosteles quadrilineatus]|uniref:uncharacterized protein LOC128996644 n=1 Tax=Macrosteles quadrilineatus TaxID=74068 RepID=UPI0023E3119A|nr:uncharacterized protein LOC128996644 [Macrosteles quadrilineatus]
MDPEIELELHGKDLYPLVKQTSTTKETLTERLSRVKKRLFLIDGRIGSPNKITKDMIDLTKTVKTVRVKCQNLRKSFTIPATKEQSHFGELFNNIGLSRRAERRHLQKTLYKLVNIIFHVLALFVSAIYIQDAYNNFRNSLIVQSLTYMNVKDIPFPAITVCEPVLLKDEYNRFEILKRCMSLENGTSWLCSEDELNMMIISNDIYPIVYDLLTMTLYEGELFQSLYIPLFGDSENVPPLDHNWTFSGVDYIKYIERLGNDRISTIQLYNIDLPGSPHRRVTLRNGSASLMTLISSIKDFHTGIYTCKSFNADNKTTMLGSTKIKMSNESANHPFLDSYHSQSCNPNNIFDSACKNDLLYTDNHMEIEFEDEIDYPIPERDDREIDDLSKKNIWFNSYFVFLHGHFDIPSMSNMKHVRLVKTTSSALVATPAVTNALQDLTEVDESLRNCVFSHERSLSLFEVYTHNNCVFECQINCSLTLCGCIPYGTAIFYSSLPICSNRKSHSCQKENQFLSNPAYKDKRCKCNCPMDCLSISYSFGGKIELNEKYSKRRTTSQVSYKEDSVLSVIRYSVTSPAEFVAYSLGILGVFNGFTIKLVYDLFYWLTLGLWSTIRNMAWHRVNI